MVSDLHTIRSVLPAGFGDLSDEQLAEAAEMAKTLMGNGGSVD